MKKLPIIALLLLTSAGLELLGCSQKGKEDDFFMCVQNFHADLRFARYGRASKYLSETERNLFDGRVEELGDDFHITEFEVIDIDTDPETGIATVEVKIMWYKLPSMSVKTTVVIEEWELIEGKWVIVSRKEKGKEELSTVP